MDSAAHGKSAGPAAVDPRWPDYKLPPNHPRLAHYGNYHGTAADVAYGDSLEATERAAREGYPGRDLNLLSTLDLVAIGNHSPVLDSFLGGRFNHRWTGPEWGEGDLIVDPKRAVPVGSRTWADVSMVTDAGGTRRIHTLDEHVAYGVELGVLQVPEAKSQTLLEGREFWARVGEVMDRHGHPRVMMTLTNYGHALGRCRAAKAEGFQVALLPRGSRPPRFEENWRPHVDALWGPAWGKLP